VHRRARTSQSETPARTCRIWPQVLRVTSNYRQTWDRKGTRSNQAFYLRNGHHSLARIGFLLARYWLRLGR